MTMRVQAAAPVLGMRAGEVRDVEPSRRVDRLVADGFLRPVTGAGPTPADEPVGWAEVDPDPDAAEDEPGLESWTVTELRRLADAEGVELPPRATKAEIIEVLADGSP